MPWLEDRFAARLENREEKAASTITATYDHANRLVQACTERSERVVSGTFTTTFAYNGDGHRLAKTENGETTNYVVAVLGLSQVLVETTGGDTTRYVYGHDLLAEYDGTEWAYHLNDGLGSVRQLADAGGDVTLAQGYTPFGVPLWSQGSGSSGYGFTGERWEAYAEVLFLRARYYEPGTGRFLAKDPIIRNHPYLYGGGNPIRFIDPTGLEYFPAADVYSCDHQGGPDPRDPYQYRLILGDSVSDYYFSVGAIKSKDPNQAVIGGYDYRGVPCWVTNIPGYGPPPPTANVSGCRPWAWTDAKWKTLKPVLEMLACQSSELTHMSPDVLMQIEEWYEMHEGAYDYWNSQQKMFDWQGVATPFEGDLISDWYYEQGADFRVYGPNSLMTQELMRDTGQRLATEDYCQQGCPATPSPFPFAYNDTLDEWQRTVARNLREFFQTFVSGSDKAGVGFSLGGHTVYIYHNCDGTAVFMIQNITSRKSGTRIPFTDIGMPRKTREQTRPDGSNWPIFSDIAGLTPGPNGWGGDLEQWYVWQAEISCCPKDCH